MVNSFGLWMAPPDPNSTLLVAAAQTAEEELEHGGTVDEG